MFPATRRQCRAVCVDAHIAAASAACHRGVTVPTSVVPPATTETRTPSAASPAATSKDIAAQLLDELWRRARTSIPAFILVMAVAWPIVREAALASVQTRLAYASVLGVAFVRWMAAIVVGRSPERLSRATRYKLMLAGSLTNGLAIGWLDLLLYRELGPLALGIWMTCIAGIAGGATVSLGARPEVFLAYATPAMGAFAAGSSPVAARSRGCRRRGHLHLAHVLVRAGRAVR